MLCDAPEATKAAADADDAAVGTSRDEEFPPSLRHDDDDGVDDRGGGGGGGGRCGGAAIIHNQMRIKWLNSGGTKHKKRQKRRSLSML